MHTDDSLRQKKRHNDERGRASGRLQHDDIRCRPSGGGRMDDLRHFPHAPRDERAFGRNDLGHPVQMRDPKSGNEERVRERDRYTERDRDRDRDLGSDRDREYTQSWRSSKQFNNVNDLNKQKILSNSDTGELFRGRHGPDRQKDRGNVKGEDRGRDSRDTNDRHNDRDRKRRCHRSRDSDIDRVRDPCSVRDSQYTLTQRPSKQFNIELNKQVMRTNRQCVKQHRFGTGPTKK